MRRRKPQFEKEYIANGGEQFLTIGNFHDDTSSSLISDGTVNLTSPGYNPHRAYAYIDLVSLEPCISGTISENHTNRTKNLLQIVDILGQESKPQPNTPLFYIFDDDTVEKRIVIE